MRRDLRTPLITFAACVLVAAVAFGYWAVHRQTIADERAETQRQAICAILANIPGRVPPEIVNARQAFSRPHHPHDCEPVRHSKTRPTPAPHPSARAAGPTVVVFPSGGGTSASSPTPRPSPRPSSSPRPTPSPTPTPQPTPTPTCSLDDLIRHPVECLERRGRPMDDDHPQQPVCVFCLVHDCDLCVGRGSDRWCECLCDWLREGAT